LKERGSNFMKYLEIVLCSASDRMISYFCLAAVEEIITGICSTLSRYGYPWLINCCLMWFARLMTFLHFYRPSSIIVMLWNLTCEIKAGLILHKNKENI